ncbi:MAG: hypothetical protein WC897_06000 [Candidatus Gracilibacteria bacterium]
MNKLIVISLSIAVLLIGGAIAYTSNNISPSSNNPKAEEIKIIDGARPEIIEGKQIIEISAKGGYFPRKTIAKAGVPTILRIKTSGTFDCSSSLFIPKLNYHKSLTPSGVENIEIPASEANGVLRGLCSMGMYNFEVDFE